MNLSEPSTSDSSTGILCVGSGWVVRSVLCPLIVFSILSGRFPLCCTSDQSSFHTSIPHWAVFSITCCLSSGFSDVENLPANAQDIRDAGSTPGLARSPGGGHGNPLQYSCLGNPMDRGSWPAIVHRVAMSQTRLKRLSMHRGSLASLWAETVTLGVQGVVSWDLLPLPHLWFWAPPSGVGHWSFCFHLLSSRGCSGFSPTLRAAWVSFSSSGRWVL